MLEGVEPNDGIVQFPVSILGYDKKSDGIPFHITLRWGKIDDEEKFVDDVTKAIDGLDLTPPKITKWTPEIFGKDKEFYVLLSPNPPANLLKIKDAIDPIFGPDPFHPYKMHITVDQELWDAVKDNYLSPNDLEVDVGPLQVVRGNKVLKTFDNKSRLGEDVDLFGIPIYG